MKRLAVSALGVLSMLGCTKDDPKPQNTDLTRANAAIKALAEADTQAVAQCQRAVDACEANVPDGKAVGVCERLAARCDALNERLASGRGPAVGCWHAVQACEEHAPEQAQCLTDPTVCESLAEEAGEQRDKALRCEARVQACLTRAEDLPAAAIVACENIAAACEHAAAAGGGRDAGADDDDDDDGDDRADAGQGDDDQGDDDQDDDDQDDDDQGDDDQDDDGTGGREHPAHPDTPRGRPSGADAGAD